EALRQLVDEQGQEQQGDDREPADDPAKYGPVAPQLQQGEREDRDEEHEPEDVQLDHRSGRPDGERPPAGAEGLTSSPGGGQRERGEEWDRVRVPDERGFLDRRRGHGEEEAGEEPGHGAPDGPPQPPRE